MASPDQLRSMDLQAIKPNDEALGYGLWDRRRDVHTLVKQTYQADKPKDDGNWWRYALGITNGSGPIPRCNLLIVVARLKAFIPQGGPANDDYDMAEEGFLVKKNLSEWSQKQMFFTKAPEKNFVHMDIAASKSSYRVGDYDCYIPIPALDTTQFIDEFMAKHGTSVPKLKKEHITVSFSVFQCGPAMMEEEQVAEHCKQIHGLNEGITSLSPLQVITVEKDQAFTCPHLHKMEDFGPEQRAFSLQRVHRERGLPCDKQ